MNKIIAIVGMAGSGKSIASDYFEKRGYQKVYFGGVIYDKMKEAGLLITPESQKNFREELRRKEGMGAVAKILLPKIKELYKNGNVVLDGLYSWDEYKILSEVFPSMIMISVICDKNIRYMRVSKRVERPFTNEEMIRRDITEIENSAKGGPIAYADYFILNNGPLESYISRLSEVLKEIEEKR